MKSTRRSDKHKRGNSHDSSSSKSKKKKSTTKVVDFFKNPTILSRLILNEKYKSAIDRLKGHPEEASTWVCSLSNKDRDGEAPRVSRRRSLASTRSSEARSNRKLDPKLLNYSIRQLPIHVACSKLFRVGQAHRTELELLITHLAVSYPDGCCQPDHEGKLPLHEAIWHNASSETISVLLMASPSTIHERDKYGRAPLELNRVRSGDDKEEIKELLLRGVAFWESARTEALVQLKRKHAKAPVITQGRGSILRGISLRMMNNGAINGDSDQLEAMSWQQLEQRAIHLEQLLTEMYEKNYELGEIVDTLSSEKVELMDEVKRLQEMQGCSGTDNEEDPTVLREENEQLRQEVARLQEQLNEKSKAALGEEQFDLDAVRYLEWRNATLQEQLDETTAQNRESQMKLDRLEIVLSSLRKKLDKKGEKSSHPIPTSIAIRETDVEWEDFENLIESITSHSPIATERFLAGKVIDLKEQLSDARLSAEKTSNTSVEENKRLVRENEVLTDLVKEFSSSASKSSDKGSGGGNSWESWIRNASGRNPAGKQQRQKRKAEKRKSFEESPYETDSLDEILRHAAQMYNSSSIDLTGASSNGQRSKLVLQEVKSDTSNSGTPPPLKLKEYKSMPAAITALSEKTPTPDSQLEYVRSPPDKARSAAWPRQESFNIYDYQANPTTRSALGAAEMTAVTWQDKVPSIESDNSLSSHKTNATKTVSDVTIDSLLRSTRLLQSGSSDASQNGNVLSADVIMALRTASFSAGVGASIEEVLKEADKLRSVPIQDDAKAFIRERYLAEGADLSALLLTWLSEALADTEEQQENEDDLDTILEELEQTGSQKRPPSVLAAWKEIVQSLPDLSDSTEDLDYDQSCFDAFQETAKVVSKRDLFASESQPFFDSFASFDPRAFPGDNYGDVFADSSGPFSHSSTPLTRATTSVTAGAASVVEIPDYARSTTSHL